MTSVSSRAFPPIPAEDLVGNRHTLIVIGMIAVWSACAVFGAARLAVTLSTGKLTPWWANVAGAVAIPALYLWYRRRPSRRSLAAVNGTALFATLALLAPVPYGMGSTVWWLGLVGFAMVMVGRRSEAWAWGAAIPLLVAATAVLEPAVQLQGAAGEPPIERSLARVVFVILLVGMAAAFRGVAERRAKDLHDSDERYRMLFQRAPLGVFHCGDDLRVTDCNQRFADILGVTRESLIGFDMGSLEDRRMLPAVRTALGGMQASYDGPYSGLDGRGEGFVSIRTVPLTSKNGAVEGALGLVEDVTERRRLEQELLRSHDDLEQRVRERTEELRRSRGVVTHILNSIPQWVFWKDRRSVYLGCNQIFAGVAGLADPEDIVGRTDAELPWRELAEAYRADDREVMDTNQPKRGIVEPILQSDGRRVWASTSKVPLTDETGAVFGVLGVVEDITERKHAEETLRQAQKIEAVGRLAGGVAHDFNNLLQVLVSQTHMLLQKSHEPAMVEELGRELVRQISRGASLTRQLLLFSRRETSRPQLCDFNDVVRDATKMLRRLVRANIVLDCELAPERLPIEADRGQLEQVLMNLVVNASDAMPEGGHLVVRTSAVEGEQMSLVVEDSGHGIPDAIRDRIFEPFFTTKDPGKGTGLGLSVVHGIVTQAGGRIEVENVGGRGTIVRVLLPRAAAGTPPEAQEATAEPRAVAGRGERVLIVEDEDGAREGLRDILTGLGYETVAVASGEEAGTLPDEPPYDLLLTDLMLPGIAGPELAVGLHERWPALRVILMSGYTEDEAVRQDSRGPGEVPAETVQHGHAGARGPGGAGRGAGRPAPVTVESPKRRALRNRRRPRPRSVAAGCGDNRSWLAPRHHTASRLRRAPVRVTCRPRGSARGQHGCTLSRRSS